MIKSIIKSLALLVVVLVAGLFAYLQYNKSPEIFASSVAGLYHQQPREVDPSSVRRTMQGEVVGFADAYQTHAWLGIPYAAAPIGELRWRAPRQTRPWQGRKEALEYGQSCMQFWGALAGEEGETGQILGSEDCLSLNIWAPAMTEAELSSSGLPVMVWIHGGGNDSGTAKIYQAHHLAGSQQVIVVLINYRVGLLGWLSHEAIRATANNPEDASGNFGTLDIIAALQWVQNNINNFGGNASNVTIFGESAGGRNVYSMLASPLAKGLFHKAISQSGSADTTLIRLSEEFSDDQSLDEVSGLKNSSNELIALALADQFPNESSAQIRHRIETTPPALLLNNLRSMDAKTLLQMASDNLGEPGYTKVARIIRDGHVIPKKSLLELFSDGDLYNAVPLILGTNRDEQKVFMARNPEYVTQLFGVLPRINDVARYNRISEYVSTNWKAGAVDEPAKLITQSSSSPVFAYRFDWDNSPNNLLVDLPELIGATHGMEVNFVFGDFKGNMPFGFTHDRSNAKGREALSLAMMDYWAEFAYSGTPAAGRSGKQVDWHAWQQQGNNIMLLDSASDGGTRMSEVRTNVADIKSRLANDEILAKPEERCEAYAALFLHGYQTSHFWNRDEYNALGCESFRIGSFRNS